MKAIWNDKYSERPISIHDEALIIAALLKEPTLLNATSLMGLHCHTARSDPILFHIYLLLRYISLKF